MKKATTRWPDRSFSAAFGVRTASAPRQLRTRRFRTAPPRPATATTQHRFRRTHPDWYTLEEVFLAHAQGQVGREEWKLRGSIRVCDQTLNSLTYFVITSLTYDN